MLGVQLDFDFKCGECYDDLRQKETNSSKEDTMANWSS